MSPPVITGVNALQGPTAGAPILPGYFYTVEVAAMMVGRTPSNLRLTLYRHKEKFDEPHYRRYGPRHIEQRLLTCHDMSVLREMFPIYVKRKIPVT